MAVARINSEFRRIDLAQERETRIIPVCRATKDEWRAYLDSENQALKSKCCEWIEGTIYIVEPLTQEHERFTGEVEGALRAQRGFVAYMVTWGSANIPGLPDLHDYEPDKGYGPANFLGAPFPPGVQDYLSWYTLIVEVGKSRGWGDNAGMLDWKASEWSLFPGVRYILCVAVTDRLATAEYKLYTVERNNNGEALPLPVLNPVPVVGPQTLVTFDSRELLGLPPGANIPRSPYSRACFPDPTFTLDLFEVLEIARRPWA
ncbi:hypothetical protein PHYSODRAFT_493907 [Phytophthora sojae]|uniref:Restriction endonuclease domain-containing protein n=1 Tax=Phytophthora sojae (strain P6497) TaxID=1094619 RepID=G4Z574_PHYSP|nr:hypothetical protein PHYSODRAFT_493907 [Phytophthora sojae]EGZ20217.1 hypothetical protein PHYSODRAFT_493907 [Phytophthora sojae]|eukprot:XP_009522934.1 hypothetical protein PHYSODRAFT_493907 [Phytophthora sojae]